MRTAFIRTLIDIAEADPRVVLMTGDLGFGVVEEFRERYPSRFYNVGVAEQNLTGVAVGLALTGSVIFTYSIANFPVMRCLEQVRNDACYHEANVKFVSVGGGLAYGALGASHFATEDLAIARSLPAMTVVAPGDPVEVEKLLPQIVAHSGPVYFRLGRAGEARLHSDEAMIVLGRVASLREGSDVLLLTTGGMLPVAMDAANALENDAISAAVVSVHTLKPLDASAICQMASQFPVTVTCEEHTIHGGLGGAVAEILMEAGARTRFRRFGLPEGFPRGVGSQGYLRSVNGLDAPALRALAVAMLRRG